MAHTRLLSTTTIFTVQLRTERHKIAQRSSLFYRHRRAPALGCCQRNWWL